MVHPCLCFGGLGIGASPYLYARAAAKLGQLGVVSGTAIQYIFARQLQLGDENGDIRRAFKAFPDQKMAARVLDRYFVENGIPGTQPFINIEQFSVNPSRDLIELTIVCNFAQVWLAKEGHDGKIGINFLEKIQMPHLYALYGALLAGVDYLFMGAGIPYQVSGVLDQLVQHKPATYNITVIGLPSGYDMVFDPREFMNCSLTELKRPLFFPIISSSTIILRMLKSGTQTIDGCVFERGKWAGGHSAPQRKEAGELIFTEAGEPVYGPKDEINFEEMRSICEKFGIGYYYAGNCASPEMLAKAKKEGAIGIQIGSIGALCNISGVIPDLRDPIRKDAYNGALVVFNDPKASPTGFPFRVVRRRDTLGDPVVYKMRKRKCDIGGLLLPYLKEDGSIGYRCSAEPKSNFLRKGGKEEEAESSICLGNGLFSTVGVGQRLKDGSIEPPVVTLGHGLAFLQHVMSSENDDYTMKDIVNHLLS